MSETNLKPGVYRIETPPRPGCLQAVGTELDKPVMALPAGPTPGATQFWKVGHSQEGQYVINAFEHGPIPIQFGWGHDEVVRPDEPVLFSGTVANWNIHKAEDGFYQISVPGGPLGVTSLVDVEERHLVIKFYPIVPGIPTPTWNFIPLNADSD